jgi:hypothetical protein
LGGSQIEIAFSRESPDNSNPIVIMSKSTSKSKKEIGVQLLALLKSVLPKATHDPQLAGKIYQAIEHELQAQARVKAFEKFCSQAPLADLEPRSVHALKEQLAESFSDADITLKPNRKEQSVAVEVALTDGSQFQSEIKVKSEEELAEEEAEATSPFVPFPVCLPGDPELVWLMGRRESLTPEEAAMALSRIEQEFWASKTGQKLIQDRVERCFPEFVTRVPSGMLSEAGLKRHYKMPEPIKILHPLPEARPHKKKLSPEPD